MMEYWLERVKEPLETLQDECYKILRRRSFKETDITYVPLVDERTPWVEKQVLQRGSAISFNPLTFYAPFVTEKAPLSYILHWQMIPHSHLI